MPVVHESVPYMANVAPVCLYAMLDTEEGFLDWFATHQDSFHPATSRLS